MVHRGSPLLALRMHVQMFCKAAIQSVALRSSADLGCAGLGGCTILSNHAHQESALVLGCIVASLCSFEQEICTLCKFFYIYVLAQSSWLTRCLLVSAVCNCFSLEL